jgi:hypothetical protein
MAVETWKMSNCTSKTPFRPPDAPRFSRATPSAQRQGFVQRSGMFAAFPSARVILVQLVLLSASVVAAQIGLSKPPATTYSTSDLKRAFQPELDQNWIAPGNEQNILPNTCAGPDFVPSFGLDALGLSGLTNEDIGIKAAIDPATQLRLAVAEQILTETGGVFPTFGYYLLDDLGEEVAPTEAESEPQSEQQQPPAQPIVLGQQVPQQPPLQATSQPRASDSQLQDRGQFTLILRNGSQIQAVAFTHVRETILYVAPDGRPGTIAVNDFDSNATLHMNQERGIPLHSPL